MDHDDAGNDNGVHCSSPAPYPSEEDLLRGKDFFRSSIFADIEEFCIRTQTSLAENEAGCGEAAVLALRDLRENPSAKTLRGVSDLAAVTGGEADKGIFLRCRYYLASIGDVDAASLISREAAMLALRNA